MKKYISILCILAIFFSLVIAVTPVFAADEYIRPLGDVDGRDGVTITDARMVLQHLVGKITLTDEQKIYAKVSEGEGDITITDARLILQYLVDKIDKFPGKLPDPPDPPDRELLNLTQYIDMNLGVRGASNTVIGPQRPHGSVNPAPDAPGYAANGYGGGDTIRGFSQIHVSGTGVPKYGQVLLSPQIGLATRLDSHDSGKRDERPFCNEYNVTLTKWNIDTSFTCTENVSLYKFTYPQSGDANLLIDMAHNNGENNNTGHHNGVYNTSSDIKIQMGIDNHDNTVIYGSGNYAGGWGRPHDVFFYAVADKTPKAVGVYDQNGARPGEIAIGPADITSETHRFAGLGAYLTFDTADRETVMLKVAMSLTSVEKAKEYIDNEVPQWDYDGVKAETQRLWNEELNRIHIDSATITTTQKKIFYTAMYHAMLMPRYRTGDIPGYGDAVMLDDHFAGWDTFRTVMPLHTLIKPSFTADLINSFITRYEKNGYVRDSMTGGLDMYEQQGGDNVDVMISDAYLKLKDAGYDVDWDKAYEIVKNHADNYRLSWKGHIGGNFAANVVPDPNPEYKTLGYIPGDSNSLSRIMCCSYTLDYAYNDFCAALMAKELGTQTDYEKYLARSANWQNLWNPNLSYGSYTGFIGPKNRAGGWIGIDSVTRDWGSWQNYFYEASSYNYSFYVPHDPEKLIELCGGMDAFCDRLLDGINNGFVDFGNEPAFLSAFMYAYTDQPYLMTDCVQKVRGGFSINGNPGNDDSGALSSWYIFTTMGLYPCAGQDFYFLTSPWVDSTTIFLENGKELTITAKNLSSTNKYIQSVKINGMEYKKTTLPHSLIAGGAEIEFTMGPWRVDYTVMSGSADLCTVTFNTGSGSKVRERLVEKDSLLTRPDDPKRPGFEFSGWYKEAACTNPWNFAADKVTASITLYAKWSLPAGVTGAVEFVRMESIPNQSKNIVSETKYLSWAYLGRNDPVVKAGDTFFTSKVTATNGDLRQENLQTYHPESPYFSWTGGSPTAAGTDVRDILWSAEGLSFDITLPAGNYEVGLIVSGIRAGALVEVHTAAGAAILEKSMWGYTGGRTYQRVFLSFDCAEAGKYTVRLMVDRSGQLDNNHSVSVFGATVEAK